jgi:hypothetical protein
MRTGMAQICLKIDETEKVRIRKLKKAEKLKIK